MPKFGERSLKNLEEAHPLLQKVARRAIEITEQDFTIIEAYRGKVEQNNAYAKGNTKVRFPNSAHNQKPACAIDVIPYPFKGWNDDNIHKELAKVNEAFQKASKELNIPIRWGADWDRDGSSKDERFIDSPHFELHPWRHFAGG